MNIKFNAALIGAALGVLAVVATPARADDWNKSTTVHFNQPVEVPGHVLLPGTYVFQLAGLQVDRNVVEIFSKDENGMEHLVTMEIAIPSYNATPTGKPRVTLAESKSGSPEAIKTWYYPGDEYGWQFDYPQARTNKVARKEAARRMGE